MMRRRRRYDRILLSVASLVCLGCAADTPSRMIDLTYPFDEHTVYWPNNKPFQHEQTAWGPTADGYWYASATYAASEHGGTHLDAPIHFGAGQDTVDRIPLDRLIGPAVVIDVRTPCAADPDYELTVQDLQAWESQHGRIPPDGLVLMLTGWGQYWPDRTRYLGSSTPDQGDTLHFPGFSRAAAEFLVRERAIRGIGIDTASIDPGRSRDFQAHQVINGANLYALENVAGLEQVPATGAVILALPMKIAGGSGGPVRIVALLP